MWNTAESGCVPEKINLKFANNSRASGMFSYCFDDTASDDAL
jgi:hypothetical protein